MVLNEVKKLKKYLYISIFLGVIALSGCTSVESDQEEIAAESLTTEQSRAINNEASPTKTEDAAPIPLKLTQEQKEEYYQKYVTIIEKLNSEDMDIKLELEPITNFVDEYWIAIEDFEKLTKDRANMSIVILENNERYNPMIVPKTVKLQIGSKEADIISKGSFDTQLNTNTPGGRQLFSAFHSISSEAANADGSWTQLGYEGSLMDGGVNYVIDVGGKFSQGGIISSHIVTLNFNCNIYGGIS